MKKTLRLKIENMTCPNCESKVERLIRMGLADSLDLIERLNVSYKNAEAVIVMGVNVDFEILKLDELANALEREGYVLKTISHDDSDTEQAPEKYDLVSFGLIILLIVSLYYFVDHFIGFNFIPEVSANASYLMLFVIGLMTSLHCVSMCGGINLSQCIVTRIEPIEKESFIKKYRPSILYNSGRVVSYTIIGGLVGAIGSVFSLSLKASGMIAIIAGSFMVLMGLNMLSISPALRKWIPQLPKLKLLEMNPNTKTHRPFYVGLLNGFMPCGPLQTMQIFALGTGSALAGALSMFAFSLGTVPLMFVFGAVSSNLSKKFTDNMLKVSAILVIVLGIIMFGRGLSLGGSVVSYAATSGYVVSEIGLSGQTVRTELSSGSYPAIVVQKGVPVKWVMDADASNINGCNNRINIPFAGIRNYRFSPGENIIEFTPTETGTFGYSCWMGMISGQIRVVDDLETIDIDFLNREKAIDTPRGGATGGCCAP